MLISELASRTKLSIDTIRFYEKKGLLDETHYERSANRYRHYSEVAVLRLNLIRLGQAAGFTLSEMSQSIRAWETDEITPQEKELYLCLKLEDIKHKIDALHEIEAYLEQKIESMHAIPEPAC
jgi:DNA-binding transcriptional MerR regulator